MNFQGTSTQHECRNDFEIRKSRAQNLNDVRSSVRETLRHSRLYSRSLQMLKNRRTLQESICMGATCMQFENSCNSDTRFCNAGLCTNPNCDFDSNWEVGSYTALDFNTDDRSPSPTISLASSVASSDSLNYHHDSHEFPKFMLEVNRREARRRRPIKRPQRTDQYKGHQRFDKRRVQTDKSKIILEFQAFTCTLYRNQSNRAGIIELLSRDWQVLLNALQVVNPNTAQDCICILISLLDQDLISLPLLNEMIRNNLLILLKEHASTSRINLLICRFLLILLKTQPACTSLVLEWIASTQLMEDLISDMVEINIATGASDHLLLISYISQLIVTDLALNACEEDQVPKLSLSWTRLFQPGLIDLICSFFFSSCSTVMGINFVNSRMLVDILANILKMLCVNVDARWAHSILRSFSGSFIYNTLSSVLEERLNETNRSLDHDEATNNYMGFLSFYRQYFPDICRKYNFEIIPEENQSTWDD